ncbi:MAG: hypothetical protein ABH833_00915 [Parcubacteria group bacterium]
MKNKTPDINNLVLFLAGTAMKPLFNNDIWQCYGYRKRPKHGSIWHKMFSKRYELESFIAKEILTMGLIDVLNGIKKSTGTFDTKLLISMGMIDQFLSATKNIFSIDLFMENLFSTYASYLKSDKSELHVPVILKAKDILNKKDFARFMVGTIKLLAVGHPANDFLLESDLIKNVVEESSKENKLEISMSQEMYKKYAHLLSEKILNNE